MSDLDPAVAELIEAAIKAKSRAYCPYSNFPVGCAVRCSDGTIFTGCNVENVVYPLGVCAEVTAVSKAVSEGHRDFQAVALSSKMPQNVVTPCGQCRQFLAEFGLDMDVYMTRGDKTFEKRTVRELLPLCPIVER